MNAQPQTAPVRYLNAYLQNDAHLVTLRRAEDGTMCRRIVPAEWVAYYAVKDLSEDFVRMLRGTRYVRSIRQEGKWWRVGFIDRRARELLVREPTSPLNVAGVTCYEGDIHPASRWAADEGVQVATPRLCFLDIETDSRVSFVDAVDGRARVLCVAIVDRATGERHARLLADESDEAEHELLSWMWKLLGAYDQVAAWNGDGFDYPVIWARSRKMRLGVDANCWLWVDQMEAFKRLNMHAAESGDEKQSMSLENIGLAVTGKGKLQVPEWARHIVGNRNMGAATYDLWAAGGKYRQLLLDYNVEDTDLLREIELKNGYLALFQTICEACSVFGNTRSLNPTVQMDGFMLKLGLQRGEHFATREFREAGHKFKGAYVMKPKLHGIGKGVHVCDFKSLYPSIILTWNMSPETKRGDVPVNGPVPEGVARTPTGVSFSTTTEGILVAALRELLRLRDYYKKLKASLPPGTPEWHAANRTSTAYKVIANSFYGVLSSVFSRFYDAQIGEGITQTAAWLIKQTIAYAEQKGWRGIYADTDSCYVQGCNEDDFRAFTQWCNAELYPRLLKEQGCAENHIKIAYEKEYRRIVFCAAKKYAGSYEHYEGVRATEDSAPEIKGLEYVRGDALRMARHLQAEVINLLVGKKPTDDVAVYREVIDRWRKRVLEGPLPLDEVKKAQSLNKPLRDYATRHRKGGGESQPAHVEVARILQERGQEVREGTRIEYVVVDGACSPMKVIPAEDYTGKEADRYHLWENQVYPPTRSLLEAAFPPVNQKGTPDVENDWARWQRVRPKPGRGRCKVLDGQLGFEMGDTRVSTESEEVKVVLGPERHLVVLEKEPEPYEEPEPIAPMAEVEERELHVVFVQGDDESMFDLEQVLIACEGDDPLTVVLWEGREDGRVAMGTFHFRVDFDSLVGDHHNRALFNRLDAHFAA